ncbi:MAG: diaminopimelate epimerase [Dehalococcoidia bacterium]|nr:diaminopimelate epimerase [Dehalococcoidia bacterium]MSQ17056.1 diaminopimelate epimerase [Dehalococcoidia bacterium]
MKFTKMQGAGNDYVYVDARRLDMDWPQVSRAVSDRHFGVGSDGLILILDSDVAHLRMRMFNADGSEGEMCGNGIRCFAKYAIERGIVSPPKGGLTVETLAGIRTVAPVYQGRRVSGARVSMGRPRLDPQDVPVTLDPAMGFKRGPALKYPVRIRDVPLPCTFVSMGNPHAVCFQDEPVGQFPLHTIGPLVEHHPMFPRRVNFEIVNLTAPGKLTARVWERGSGETQACGTGACAIAVAGRLLGLTGDIVDISLPGGALTIQWDGSGEVFLEGPAVEVFNGEWGPE